MTVAQARTKRVGAAALDPRADVVAHLAARGAALADDLGEGEDARCGRPRRAGRSRRRSRGRSGGGAVEHRAHRQHRVRRVAGEDVGAAGAVGVEQPAPVGVAPLELCGVARMVGDDRRAPLLLPPAEGGHVLVVAVQEARLAGAGLRGPVGLPAPQPVRAARAPSARGAGRCRRAARAAGRRGRARRSRGRARPGRRSRPPACGAGPGGAPPAGARNGPRRSPAARRPPPSRRPSRS